MSFLSNIVYRNQKGLCFLFLYSCFYQDGKLLFKGKALTVLCGQDMTLHCTQSLVPTRPRSAILPAADWSVVTILASDWMLEPQP